MPTSKEQVPNKALSGSELKQIIKNHYERLLDNLGLLSSQMAFGRVAFSIRVAIHLDQTQAMPGWPTTHDIDYSSRPEPARAVEDNPSLGAIESAPLLNPSEDAVLKAAESVTQITSPNAERVRNGIEVPVMRKQQDGSTTEERIKYPVDPNIPDNTTVTDVSEEIRATWGLPAEAPAPIPELAGGEEK